MQSQPSSGRSRIAGMLLVSAVLVACSNDPKPPATAKVTSPSTSASSTTAAPKPTTTTAPKPRLVYAHQFTPAQKKVAQGYFAAVQAYLHAASGPTPHDLALAQTHLGSMLTAAEIRVADFAKRGQAVRLPRSSRFAVRVDAVDVHGSIASLSVCSLDDGVVFQRATGHIVDATVGSSTQVVTMRSDRGIWKLADRTAPKRQQGNLACRL